MAPYKPTIEDVQQEAEALDFNLQVHGNAIDLDQRGGGDCGTFIGNTSVEMAYDYLQERRSARQTLDE